MHDTQIKRIEPGLRLSEAVIHNNIVYLAGQVAQDTQLDISGQTQQVLQAIDRVLQLAGTDKSKLLMVQIFLSDIQDIGAMNQVWDTWVSPLKSPRATVQAALADPNWKIEIVATAAIFNDR